MNRKIFFIGIGLTFLVTVLFIGTPFEFLNVTVFTIAFYLGLLFFIFLFVLLFWQTRQLKKKIVKWILFGLLTVVAIPYTLIGLWNFLIFSSYPPPMWEDVRIYTNDKNEKVIGQFRETSGSIHDFRNRKIIADFGQFRISFDCNMKKLKGVWTEYDIKRNTTTIKNFDEKEMPSR